MCGELRRFIADVHCLSLFASLSTGAAYAQVVRSVGGVSVPDGWRLQCVSETSLTIMVWVRGEEGKVVGAGGKRPQMNWSQVGPARNNECALAMALI
jgi:hypothetical protein